MSLTKKSSYFYNLPEELIAQRPIKGRKYSRMMVLKQENKTIEHRKFTDIISYFKSGDVLVRNNTKVIPARLLGTKPTGAKVEIFLLNRKEEGVWECLVKPGRRLKPGAKVIFSDDFSAEIVDFAEQGARLVKFNWNGNFWKVLHKHGEMPLPPYIERDAVEEDKETYQTVYANKQGSVAAPTAGLHFTEEVFEKLREKGVKIVDVMLHVGLGTFRPVKSDDILEHEMHSEYCEISPQAAKIINQAKDDNHRIIAVGTTSTRTLESFAEENRVKSGCKWTELFLYPGKKVQIIDGLLTNFHMPESTLLMLVSALAGYDFIMKAYKTAVKEKYRFFSYGDAMLII